MTPVLVLVFNAVWGLVAAFALERARVVPAPHPSL
jgi:hypothetical protein